MTAIKKIGEITYPFQELFGVDKWHCIESYLDGAYICEDWIKKNADGTFYRSEYTLFYGLPTSIPHALQKYFSSISTYPSQIEWRLSCYHAGSEYAAEIEKHHFPLKGKKVLDMSCAWGGHSIAFAVRGAHVTAADLKDHRFDALRTFCDRLNLRVRVIQADCQALPIDEKFDVILALDLIEHIPDPAAMAAEIKRLLRPGGVCIITTPPKLLSVVWGEPHWQLKGLALLPFRWQGWIARKLFGRSYPFPIERQYTRASQVGALFDGMKYKAIPASRKLPLPSLFWGRIEITH